MNVMECSGYGIIFDAQFTNTCNCVVTESPMQFIMKCEQTSTISRIQASTSTFEDHRLEQTDFAVVHYRARPGIVLL